MPTSSQEISCRPPTTALVAAIPGMLMPLIVMRPFAAGVKAWSALYIVCTLVLAVALLLVAVAASRKRTPLLRVDSMTMTVFGPGKAQPSAFALSAVTWVAFDARPDFWRNALRLTVYTDGQPHALWIGRLPARELAELDGLLRHTFGTRYQRGRPR
jgi:hypothetical protein